MSTFHINDSFTYLRSIFIPLAADGRQADDDTLELQQLQ